jgi:hypothetical protein
MVPLTSNLVEIGDSTPAGNLYEVSRNYTAASVHLATSVSGTSTGENTDISAAYAGGTAPATPATNSNGFTSVYAPFTEATFLAGGAPPYVDFTVTAIRNGTLTRSATSRKYWTQIVHFDVGTVPGAFNSAFVQSLAGSLALTNRGSFTTTATGATTYIFFAYRSAYNTIYGAPSFTIGGFSGGMTLVASGVSVTNSHSVTETFEIYQSDTPNLGYTTVVVS